MVGGELADFPRLLPCCPLWWMGGGWGGRGRQPRECGPLAGAGLRASAGPPPGAVRHRAARSRFGLPHLLQHLLSLLLLHLL